MFWFLKLEIVTKFGTGSLCLGNSSEWKLVFVVLFSFEIASHYLK